MQTDIFDVVQSIDWAELRSQKIWLATQPVPMADGLLNLLDALQDAAVAQGLATEEEVFGA